MEPTVAPGPGLSNRDRPRARIMARRSRVNPLHRLPGPTSGSPGLAAVSPAARASIPPVLAACRGIRAEPGDCLPLPILEYTRGDGTRIEYSAPIGDEVRTTTCYMCACRCGIRVHLKDGDGPLHRGQPGPPRQPRGALREGLRRHHAALLAGAALAAAPSHRRARAGRVPGDLVGGGHRARGGVAPPPPRDGPPQARVLHGTRPEPGPHRLVGEPLRHPQPRGARGLLLGQHGGGRALLDRRLLLGVR